MADVLRMGCGGSESEHRDLLRGVIHVGDDGGSVDVVRSGPILDLF